MPPHSLFPAKAARLLYGTDFPNIPFAWDRELGVALAEALPPADARALFYGNAARLYGE